MSTLLLLNISRLLQTPKRNIFKTIYNHQYLISLKIISLDICLNARNMSQKSIKSFFKITPKKGDTKEDEKEERVKRSRSSSTESESSKTVGQSSVSSNKKKTMKRQRIESSGSESEKLTTTNFEEMSKIKLENCNTPKTLNSPKNKRTKLKGKEEEKKVKKEGKGQEKDVKINSATLSFIPIKKEKLNEVKVNGIEKENVKNELQAEAIKVAETDYNPAKLKYHPINDACWSKGQEIPYLALAKTLESIEATSARLKMVEILSNYFRSVISLTPEDLLPSIYLCLNQLAPAYHNLELGIAETYLMKAVGQCTGRTLAQMRSAAQRTGDLGLVAEQARTKQRTMFAAPPLTVRRVFAALREVAAMTGQASVNKKISKIQSLYVACRTIEARYLIRSFEGKLRVGLAEQSLLQALALACASTPPAGERAGELDVASRTSPEQFKARVDEFALIVKTTYCECPNYELVVPALLRHGIAALPEYCRLTPGIPIKPMLAHPTKGVHEIFNRFEGETFTCEWKYDGERAQIHVPGEGHAPSIFSRNQEDNTSKYPDVLKGLPALLKDTVQSCVLDCEVVAYDAANEQILPFQVLSTRKRKDATEADIKVRVCVFLFDLLYLNGCALVRRPLRERRALLREHFTQVKGEWQMAISRDCEDAEEVQRFLQESLKGCCEGLMVKALNGERSRYDIARRSRNWLKLKKDYLDGVGDTVDAVVLGAYVGRGRRAGAFGGFLLGCYDASTEQYQSLCKIGTGFSDEDLQTLSEALRRHAIDGPRNYYMFDSAHAPDVWFEAAHVWEVRCADLSLSPAHRAAIGLVDSDKGISLRFPRFVRVREDKAPEQATSAQQVAQLYLSQEQVKSDVGKRKQLEYDDFY